MTQIAEPVLLSVSAVARVLCVSEPRVREMADQGLIKVIRDSAGRRLFRQEDVESLAQDRKKARGRAAAGR
jgi:excisionase family DNA binding protein